MFMNGIASVTAGTTAAVEATWMLPLPLSAFAGARAKWEVLDKQGSVWSYGDASSLATTIAPVGTDTHIRVTGTITVPVDAPADAESGSSYQVRWTLEYGNQKQFAFDSFTVYPQQADAHGPENIVGLHGESLEVSILLPVEEDGVKLDLYYQNEPMGQYAPTKRDAPGGMRYTVQLPGDYRPGPSLIPYTCLWRYGPTNRKRMENGSLWLINPTILQASEEVRHFLTKAYADSRIDPGPEFDPATLIQHLQSGAELFNALGYPTSFTMVRASGPLRALWLRASMIQAARAQYLHEGMKAFNYGGQVVNLDVDRSQYWDSIAQALSSELDQHIKPFKENLVRRGILSGDGNIDANSLRFGAVGAIGIALTPVSPIRGAASLLGVRGRRG